MNAFCPNPAERTVFPPFMENPTCINPDYHDDFAQPVDPVKVALIGFISLGIIGMFYIVSQYNRVVSEVLAERKATQTTYEKHQNEIDESNKTDRQQIVGFINNPRSRRSAINEQNWVNEEYKKIDSRITRASQKDAAEHSKCCICWDKINFGELIFTHTTAQGINHIVHQKCIKIDANNKLAHRQIIRCAMCMSSLEEKMDH